MTLRRLVGSLLIVGVEGVQLTDAERAWLRLIQPSGVILFRRNIEEAAQVHALLAEASGIANAPIFKCVDMEGGLVDRLRDLVAPMPAAAAVAATGRKKLFREHGRLIGEEVSLLGFNTTLAPVLDLALPASAAVMRSRVAAREAEAVIAYARGFLTGLRDARVLGSGKHFPGLGAGTLDSHQATPEIDRGWEQLWKEDLLPYRKLRRQLPLVMVSHAAYPRVKAASGPASVSRYWIHEVLQRKIGFRGLVISDDLEMGGILTHTSIEQAAIAAVEAGTHLLEICKEPVLILRAYEALLSEAERSRGFRRRIEQAAAKIAREKRRLLSRLKPAEPPTLLQMEAMRARIIRFSAAVQKQAAKETRA